MPHFSPNIIKFLASGSRASYISTHLHYHQISNQYTKTIEVDQNTFEKCQEKQIYYENDNKSQSINYLSLMRTTFDLSRVTVFEGIPTTTSTIFMDWILLLPRLEQIYSQYSPKFFNKLPLLSKIRRLRLWANKPDEKYFRKDIDELCRVFSYIEHLYLTMRIKNDLIFYLIEQLNSLSSIAIICKPDDQILTNIDHWNHEQTFLSVIPIHSNVVGRERLALI